MPEMSAFFLCFRQQQIC